MSLACCRDPQGYLIDSDSVSEAAAVSERSDLFIKKASSISSLIERVFPLSLRLFLNKHLFYPFLSGAFSALTLYLRQRLFSRRC